MTEVRVTVVTCNNRDKFIGAATEFVTWLMASLLLMELSRPWPTRNLT